MSSVQTGPASGPGILVGRAAERTTLLDALARLTVGAGGAVAVLGPAGMGKSRLTRELVGAARDLSVPVLVGRAVPAASAVPYRAVREALLSWSRNRALPDAAALGGFARAVDHLLEGGSTETQPLSPEYVAEGYLRVLATIGGTAPDPSSPTPARGPGCVVVLEDLHWADEETVAVVEYLADHAASTGVLAVLTSRQDEPGPARPVLEALAARDSLQPLRLAPLERDGVGELAASVLGAQVSPSLVDLLHERSEGVPLLVEELVVALQSSGGLREGGQGLEATEAAAVVLPHSVADTVRARLGDLPPDHRSALETAAVFGRSFDWQLLPAAAELSEPVVLDALRSGTESALLEPDPVRPGGLRFRHALIRDAVVAATFPPQRVLLTRRALDLVLVRLDGDRADDETRAVAVELAAACDDRRLAARLSLEIAWSSLHRWSLRSCERWLTLARRYAGSDRDLLVDIDILQLRVGTLVGRIDVVRAVGNALLVRAGDDPAVRMETHLRLGQVEAEDGSWQASQEHLAAAQPLLEPVGDACSFTRHALWSAEASLAQGEPEEARRHALRAIELAQPYGDQVDLVCSGLMRLGRAALPDLDEARSLWRRGLALADAHGLRLWRGRLLAELAGAAVSDIAGAEELAEALASAHEVGDVELTERCELLLAELALLRWRPDEATAHLATAEAVARRGEVISSTRDRATALHGLLAAVSGHETRPTGDEALDRCLHGVGALARDDLASAATAVPVGAPAVGPAAPYDALLSLLSPRRADTTVPRHSVLGRGLAEAGAAVRAAHGGDADEAAARLLSAATLLEQAPWLAAMAVRVVAPAALATGAGEPLRAPLREAAATLDRLGLERPAEACRALLRETGVAVPRRHSAQAGVPEHLRELGVTARELEVLLLVAEGLSSRDIAERLYLSPRTVEKHVERLLAKTGAANRTALAALAVRPAT